MPIPKAGSEVAMTATRPRLGALVVAAGVVALLIAATLALWAHYGTAVFFETIAAGIAACF